MNIVIRQKDGDSEIKIVRNLDDGSMILSKPTKTLTPALKAFVEGFIGSVDEYDRKRILRFIEEAELREVLVGKELCG